MQNHIETWKFHQSRALRNRNKTQRYSMSDHLYRGRQENKEHYFFDYNLLSANLVLTIHNSPRNYRGELIETHSSISLLL